MTQEIFLLTVFLVPRDAVTARRRDGAHAVGPGGGALERVGSREDAAFLEVVTVSTRSIRSARSFTVKCDKGLGFIALLLRGTVGNARTGTGGHPRVRVLRVSLPLRRAVTVTTTAIVRITNIQIIRTRIRLLILTVIARKMCREEKLGVF